jgi:hypothetical protein
LFFFFRLFFRLFFSLSSSCPMTEQQLKKGLGLFSACEFAVLDGSRTFYLG